MVDYALTRNHIVLTIFILFSVFSQEISKIK